MELTYHLEPKTDESPLGYYRRLSSVNGLRNWKELASLAQTSPSRTGLLGRPEHIAAMYNLPAEWTAAVAQTEEGLRAIRSLHRSHHDAVCPKCLSEDMYLRASWEHAYVTACPRHKVRLVERCPACDVFLSTQRQQVEVCDCGQELCLAPTDMATPAQLWLSSGLSRYTDGNRSQLPDVAEVEPAKLAELVRALCVYSDPGSAAPRRNAASPNSVNEAIEFLSPLEVLLDNWPTSYEHHVRSRIAAGTGNARTLKALLGPWFQHLRAAAVQGGGLGMFLSPVLRIAAVEFDGVIGMEDAGAWEDLDYVRLKDAAKYGQMTVPTLRRAIASKQIAHRSRRFGTKGLVYEVQRTELEEVVEARRGWMTEGAACKALDVPPKVLTNMATAGLVQADYDWVKDVLKGGPIQSGSVEQAMVSMRANVASTPSAGERITFQDLTSRRLGDNTAIQTLMRAIHTGEVQAQESAATVGQLPYLLADVRRFFGTPLLEAGLSVSQLAKLTGWKHESIDHWIESGLLESFPIVLRGQPCRVVMPAQLLAFNRTYMPMSDLARLVGSRSSFMKRRLEQIGVVGGRPTSNGTERGMLVRLADIASLAMGTANLGKLAARDGRAGRKRKPK
jgi:hypothetical protein